MGMTMLGALLSYPLKLCGARPIGSAVVIISNLAALVAIDVAFGAIQYDALSADFEPSDAARLYLVIGSFFSALIGGLTMGLALHHLGLRRRGPHVVDGVAMFALSIWYGIAVLLPFVILGYGLVAVLTYFAPESQRLVFGSIAAVPVVIVFVYVVVRLSFAGPQTLVVGRLQLYRSWPLTKGQALPILRYGLAVLIVAMAPWLAYVGASLVIPAADWIRSWQDALVPWTFAHLVLSELSFVLATFYFNAGMVCLFDRMLSPPPPKPTGATTAA